MKICIDCNDKHYAKGYCLKHYYRLKRYGSSNIVKTVRLSEEERASYDGLYTGKKQNKERNSKMSLIYYHNRRDKAYQIMGGCCENCGYNNFKALQIDHKNGNSKSDPRIRVQQRHIFIIEYTKEAKKIYSLLCANCNWIKRFDNREMGCIKYERV